jgi:hypothetical protein
MKIFLLMRVLLYCILIFIIPISLSGQEIVSHGEINWKGVVKENISDDQTIEYLYFDDAQVDLSTGLPAYIESFHLKSSNVELEVEFVSQTFEPCSPGESLFLQTSGFTNQSIIICAEVGFEKKKPLGIVSFTPLRFNMETGVYEKLIEFGLKVISVQKSQNGGGLSNRSYAEHSILSSGEWYKIKVDKTGVYKITYDDLVSYGINPESINPKDIRIYGNGGGMLPEKNSISRPDDLIENSIFVSGEDDGVFNEEDYILFFGQGPDKWYDVFGYFDYNINLYTDFSFYYLSYSQGAGSRIMQQPQTVDNPSGVVSTYNYYTAYQEERINLIKSGKFWYSDEFGENLEYEYDFIIPDIDTSSLVTVKTGFANRTFTNDTIVVTANGEQVDKVTMTSVTLGSVLYARTKKRTFYYQSASDLIKLKYKYFPSSISSMAWLDNIRINARCKLKISNSQLYFRDLNSIAEGFISDFVLSGANGNTQVWEVTNIYNPKNIQFDINDQEIHFRLHTDSLREFITFDNSLLLSPEFVGTVENQDLHSLSGADMIIVTHPLFTDASHRVAQLHEEKDGLTTIIVTTDQVFNEFSSGVPDPTSIRDFIKMLYDRSDGAEPKFLLLMGDGSFDPKDRIENNTNYIPTFQTNQSWNTAASYVMDDYFGFLDDNEGNDGSGVLDIGIGRFPITNPDDASTIVDKIEHYYKTALPPFGTWRNRICFIADDQDNNLHLQQADSLSARVTNSDPLYNQNKIYLDAYTQESTPSGKKYPEVNAAIEKQIEEGVLIMNYIGHGGELGWAHEGILGISDIVSWTNYDMLPVFVTATCEFSRFDDPYLVSAGEIVLLTPAGGGIALFTTTRLAYALANYSLNKRFYNNAFEKVDGKFPTFGDLIRLSKPPGQTNTKNFVLLGDPAMRMAYPGYEIVTTEVNGQNISNGESLDTLSALTEITVKGMIVDNSGEKNSSFNGNIIPTVFDKITTYKTRGNDSNSIPVNFYCQDKSIFEGISTVTDGEFSFTFIVPKDIAYNFGNGKISYYAYSDDSDATGYFNDVIVGGLNQNANADNEGPEIKLYMNDNGFVSGDQTNDSPVLMADLYDKHGINISQNGIGHDIVVEIDGDTYNSIILNNFFAPEVDSYQKGSITYPFFNLPDGHHTLTLKAWDTYNNSSVASIDFVISSNATLSLSKVMNMPNPFSLETTFTLDHSHPGDELEISLEIFNLSGRRVLSWSTSAMSTGTTIPYFTWNGTDASGGNLDNGMYLYKVTVTAESGDVTSTVQKLIISR